MSLCQRSNWMMNCEHETLNKIMNSNYIWHKIYIFCGIYLAWRLMGVWDVVTDLFFYHICLCIVIGCVSVYIYSKVCVWMCIWRFACLLYVISIINNMWKQKLDHSKWLNERPNQTNKPNTEHRHRPAFNPHEIVHIH